MASMDQLWRTAVGLIGAYWYTAFPAMCVRSAFRAATPIEVWHHSFCTGPIACRARDRFGPHLQSPRQLFCCGVRRPRCPLAPKDEHCSAPTVPRVTAPMRAETGRSLVP